MFFRESCFRQSGDVKRSSNPTHYRNPRDYFAIFDGVEVGLLRVSKPPSAYYISSSSLAHFLRVGNGRLELYWY